jgi:hypothetical protein
MRNEEEEEGEERAWTKSKTKIARKAGFRKKELLERHVDSNASIGLPGTTSVVACCVQIWSG